MKKIVYIIIIILILCLFVVIGLTSNHDNDINKIDLNDVDNLMIVAHPDDETLWGGAHLIRDSYLVVCITCGNNWTRSNEIKNVLKQTDDKILMLGYPDKVNGQRSDWKKEKSSIYKDIEKIIKYKHWNSIATHNKDGEYGHQHHIMTNEITTSVYKATGSSAELYYFGKYYSKNKLGEYLEILDEIDEVELNKKEELLKIYSSQSNTIKKFEHMNKYENWIKQE